ncbi:MAG: hypothetical protein V4582_25225 [Pseudomonadota bacterium]
MTAAQHGTFTISLDLEAYWGVRDKRSIEQYEQNLRGEGAAIDAMLGLFAANGVHATWATVGFMFCRDRAELAARLPARLPHYAQENLSPYPYIAAADSLDAAVHFAPDAIARIAAQDGQEVATHTFSHYYCLEAGQDRPAFEADLRAAQALARERGLELRSLVFPRNHVNPEYLDLLPTLGIDCYRGNPQSWIYKAFDEDSQSLAQRAVRLLDAYLNLSGHHTHRFDDCVRAGAPFNFAASRFLRPYSRKLAWLDGLRLRRITRALDDAARNKRIFHLWWHPHNFGRDLERNIAFLGAVLAHFKRLERSDGMRSLNMGELAQLARGGACP